MTAFVISLREGLEAALIVGILLGALRRLGRPRLSRAVWAGVGSAVSISALAAAGLVAAGIELEGRAEALFEGITLLLAAGFLTGMIFWMRRQGAQFREALAARTVQAAEAAAAPGNWALFGVAFLAVVREGLELALLLVATSLQNPAFATLVGALIGLAAATLLGVLLYRGVVRLNLRLFFAVTNVLLLLFAAGMVGLGIHELVEAGIAPAIVEPVYDINPFFSDQSLAGEMLKSLFGFNGNPALSEALAYIAYLVAASWYLFGPAQRRPATPAALTGR